MMVGALYSYFAIRLLGGCLNDLDEYKAGPSVEVNHNSHIVTSNCRTCKIQMGVDG